MPDTSHKKVAERLKALSDRAEKKFQDALKIEDPRDPAYELAWEAYDEADRDFWDEIGRQHDRR